MVVSRTIFSWLFQDYFNVFHQLKIFISFSWFHLFFQQVFTLFSRISYDENFHCISVDFNIYFFLLISTSFWGNGNSKQEKFKLLDGNFSSTNNISYEKRKFLLKSSQSHWGLDPSKISCSLWVLVSCQVCPYQFKSNCQYFFTKIQILNHNFPLECKMINWVIWEKNWHKFFLQNFPKMWEIGFWETH